MPTVHTVPTDYATLATALAHADVKNGDTIQLHDTHVENTADITISKEVTIKTLGSGKATISKKILLDASNVTLTNLKLNNAGEMIAQKSGKILKNFTVNYCLFDCLSAGHTEDILFYGHTSTATTKLTGAFTFDNNTVLQCRSGAALELGQGASGASVEEFYCRDNTFIDHLGSIVNRGGCYEHYQAAVGDDTNGWVKSKAGNFVNSTTCNKAVVSGNKVNVNSIPGTAAAALEAKNAGGSSDGSAYTVTAATYPWGMFELNQTKDVEFNNNLIKSIITHYPMAACLQTWNASEEWNLNVTNNVFQDMSGCGGIKVYVRYYGYGYDQSGNSWGYMPGGKIEKNDFINVDMFALSTDCKYSHTKKASTAAKHDTYTEAEYKTAAANNTTGGTPSNPNASYDKKTIYASNQKWQNYATKPTLNCQDNYFFPTTGLPGSDVSGNDVAVSNNVPPRLYDLDLNELVGDADGDHQMDDDSASSAPALNPARSTSSNSQYQQWIFHDKNSSSVLNCFNYTFPDANENSVLLQQGAVATMDTRNYSLTRHNQYLDYNTYNTYAADANLSIQVPVLFDVSGGALLYGEEFADDMIDAHLQFTLDMRTDETNSFNVADLTGCFRVGDQDVSGHNLFYVNNHNDSSGNQVDLLCEKLSNAILEGKLKHIVSDGDHSTSGIPIGGQSLVTSDGSANSLATYTKKYLTSIAPVSGAGENVGTCMARLAAVHLVGHPLSQAIFTNEKMLQTDVARTTTINKGDDTNAFANTLATQLSKALGGSYNNAHDGVGGDASGNRVLLPGLAAAGDNTTGVQCNNGTVNAVLQSIYEQLIANGGRATEINTATDLSLNDSVVTRTTTAPFPFHADDELVVYIRPKLHLSFDTAVQTGVAILDSDGAPMDISGLVHHDAVASNMEVAFPGCSAGHNGGQAYKYGWMGSQDNIRSSGNARDLDQETTDETDPTVLDAHVWKITIKL